MPEEASTPRVAIVADNISARFGGEALDPLHYFRVLRSRGIEAHLVTHARNATELRELFPDDCERMHFVADTKLHRLLWRLQRLLPRRAGEVTLGLLSHLYTQKLERRVLRELCHARQIDVVHQPIPLSPKYPSLIFGVEAPVVIGPLNGGMDFPSAFRSRQGRLDELAVRVGRRLSNLRNRTLPGKRRADVIVVANQRTRSQLPGHIRGKVVELVDNGVDLGVWKPDAAIEKAAIGPPRFIYIGRLVDWKGVDLLLEAFADVARRINAVLEIVGDGVLRHQLEHQAQRLGIAERVIFAGWMSQHQCADRLRESDAFVLPSLLECGGAVVLEAMAMALPVIATNWGGPADYLDASCGILVEPDSRQGFIEGLSAAMVKLARDPQLRRSMGLAGRDRVRRHFDWESKADRMLEIYREAQAAHSAPYQPELQAAVT